MNTVRLDYGVIEVLGYERSEGGSVIRANEEGFLTLGNGAADLAEIIALEPGESFEFGGSATPFCVLTVDDPGLAK